MYLLSLKELFFVSVVATAMLFGGNSHAEEIQQDLQEGFHTSVNVDGSSVSVGGWDFSVNFSFVKNF